MIKRIFIGIFALVSLLLACSESFLLGKEYYSVYQSKSWIETKAWVTDAQVKVEEVQTTTAKGSIGRSRYYTPVVAYDYVVDGDKYRGNRIDFSAKRLSYGSSQYAHGAVREIFNNENQSIFYNPNNPSESVALRQVGDKALTRILMCIILGFGFFPLSLFALYVEVVNKE